MPSFTNGTANHGRYLLLEGNTLELSDANLLQEAFDRAIKTAKWKSACQKADHDSLSLITKIKKELEDGTYKSDALSTFIISERGKTRVINGNSIKDRTVRHAICDNILMPIIQNRVIYDNSASQVGKGVDFARRRFKVHLQRFYRKHGNKGYVLMIDFSKYYDNILHDVAYQQLAEHISDERIKAILADIFDSFKRDVSYMTDEEYSNINSMKFNSIEYEAIPNTVKTGEKFMRKSVPIGDQTSQIVGVYYPYLIDNYVKIVKGVKHYGRYMDDIYIIHEDKQFLKDLLVEIRQIADGLGLHINEHKTQIYRIDRPFHYLQNLYYVTDTGRIVEKINKGRLTRMRRKLKKLAAMVMAGTRVLDDIENMYRSWMGAYKRIMSKRQINSMNRLYDELFGGLNHG